MLSDLLFKGACMTPYSSGSAFLFRADWLPRHLRTQKGTQQLLCGPYVHVSESNFPPLKKRGWLSIYLSDFTACTRMDQVRCDRKHDEEGRGFETPPGCTRLCEVWRASGCWSIHERRALRTAGPSSTHPKLPRRNAAESMCCSADLYDPIS